MVKNIKLALIGIISGFVSGFFFFFLGLILVPAFMYLVKLKSNEARGTSVFCILPMVITSSFFYYQGHFIDWKVSILCALGGAIGGYIGAKLLRRIPEKYLKIVFATIFSYVAYRILTAW